MCKLTYKKNNTGDFIMKNTVKLEQFKEVTEAELQEIRGGDKRGLMDLFKQIPIFRRK